MRLPPSLQGLTDPSPPQGLADAGELLVPLHALHTLQGLADPVELLVRLQRGQTKVGDEFARPLLLPLQSSLA